MQCPTCAEALIHRDHKHNGFIGIDQCDKCHGCWLDHSELEHLEAGVWADVDALGVDLADALGDTQCPRCEAQMTAFALPGQIKMRFDRCPACHGIWLDSGELRQLQKALDHHADEQGKPLTDRPDDWPWIHWAAYRFLSLGTPGSVPPPGAGWG